MTGRTQSGFTAEIQDNALDDIELFDDLCEMDRKNLRVLPNVMAKLLGAEGKKALYEHCRGEDGIVRMSAVAQELNELIVSLNTGKK